MKNTIYAVCISLIMTLCVQPSALLIAGEINVNSYYGEYDTTQKKKGFPSASLKGPVTETWRTPTPKKAYHIGVLFPHLKDSYWITANYGIISHAKKLGVNVTLHEAGAYINFGNQRAQLLGLAKKKNIDGIILASVDYSSMDRFVKAVVHSGIPVIALINDILAPDIQAKCLLSFYRVGYKVGEFVSQDSGGKDVKICFFAGPKRAGWSSEMYEGFKAAIFKLKKPDQKITFPEPSYGDTRPRVQQLRLSFLLSNPKNYQTDYIICNAVAAAEAVDYLRRHRANHPKAKIVSTYITIDIYEHLKQGSIIAAPDLKTISQCSVALDMMVRLLNGEQPGKDFPFNISPIIPMVTKENISQYSYEDLFGKKDFVPVVHTFKY
ncbi:TMAO reductase system periplasmic protein TorT [Desulfonema magnum]|uniref:ABC transporter, periplasmic binding protein n=1 Tax=Desulfonema magnum TaxID=45655 RepID=A0A975BUR3_9BACT|nr:TMAO reductase system periplasmic protein TorT [Desulfonema magnum]QTA91862.1 putative ABC transporter, periplasmic binding protein [Desulfonema magnum]